MESLASEITSLTSFTPDEIADNSTNFRLEALAIIWAIVVFPLPGGPHNKILTAADLSPSKSRLSGEPTLRTFDCPTSSDAFRGRIRTASGAVAEFSKIDT